MTTGQPMREPTFHVLAAMLDGPLHGYGIIRRAHELTDGRVRLAAGTLYTALDVQLARWVACALRRDVGYRNGRLASRLPELFGRLRKPQGLVRSALGPSCTTSPRPGSTPWRRARRRVRASKSIPNTNRGGDGWESNPPGTAQHRPTDGFEVCGGPPTCG